MADVNLDPLPENITQSKTEEENIETYKQRLLDSHVKTPFELDKMQPEQIVKEYLNHEKTIAEQMKTNIMQLLSKSYVKGLNNILPVISKNKAQIEQEQELERKLGEDVFIKAFIDKYFPDLYFKYGALLGPFSLAAHTVSHVSINKNFNLEENETRNSSGEEKSQEVENEG